MSFSVEWSKAATKQLLSIPKKQRLIILSWVQEHLDGCEDPSTRTCRDCKTEEVPVSQLIAIAAGESSQRLTRP